MKIIQIVPFEERTPPKKYGGTELVASNITEELLKRGHDVYLVATGDAVTNAKLFPVFPESIRQLPEAQDPRIRDAIKFIGVGKALEFLVKTDADILHNHLGWRLLPFLHLLKYPVVTTLHGPTNVPYVNFIHKKFTKDNFVSISNSQRNALLELNYVGTVYNGIDVKKLEFSDKPKDYFSFLGRMSPEKGPVQAIKIARMAGVKLKMAAKVDAVDLEYFKKEVEPLIDGKQIEFIGEIGPAEKSDFLKNSIGLIAPIQWEEPFGLFFVEAMACGAPVIACRRGSVPEIVKDKKTGFIIDTIEEGAEAVKNIDKISRTACRKHVEENFTIEKMVDGYEKIYKKILKK
jgi:glycosyltransferase involved in cell wall biosynthesis